MSIELLNRYFRTLLEAKGRQPMSVVQRRKAAMRMKRMAVIMARKRAIQKTRIATQSRLETRSRRAAIKFIRRRVAGQMGTNYSKLSPSQKSQIDKLVYKRTRLVNVVSKRLLPRVRKAEVMRKTGARRGK